ncbi:unnamed protein product [Clavelina lepadiformis]|uniref:Sushi domain-containing protein n=1 Tax=Clavelina lepadiformis TaxID=159417 RepID=A0ABP0FGF5_CLALP
MCRVFVLMFTINRNNNNTSLLRRSRLKNYQLYFIISNITDVLVVHPHPTFYTTTSVHSPPPKDNPFQTTVYGMTHIIPNPKVSCNGVGRWNVDTSCITSGSIYTPWQTCSPVIFKL